MGHVPACVNECPAVMREMIAKFDGFGTEATVSHMPPLFVSPYPPIVMTCPHGVKWYAEPTSEQKAAWLRDGVA